MRNKAAFAPAFCWSSHGEEMIIIVFPITGFCGTTRIFASVTDSSTYGAATLFDVIMSSLQDFRTCSKSGIARVLRFRNTKLLATQYDFRNLRHKKMLSCGGGGIHNHRSLQGPKYSPE